MLSPEIEQELLQITPVEQRQIDNHGQNIEDVTLESIPETGPIQIMPYWNFFDYGRIAVTESNRFSYIPAHKHKFIELNYCISGQSMQYIDDKKIILNPGQLLIMDRNVQQRINYARKKDILVNILIRDNYEVSLLLDKIDLECNTMVKLLANSTKHNFNHNNYLVFDLNNNLVAKQLIENIITLGLNQQGKNIQPIQAMMRALILCVEDSDIVKEVINFIEVKQDKNLQIIEYLNNHYQTVTLNSLADHFGYNSNYLGNKIKESSGHTFKELLQMRRLNIACNLIQITKMPLDEITAFVGYDNPSSLFRLFKSYLHLSPQEYRKRILLPRQLDENEGISLNPYFEE